MTSKFKKLLTLFSIFGPGLVVMLADADAGSIITAAQSGAIWGYKLLLIQFILIPILFMAQELTVRLGLVTGQGHASLIKKHFGNFWAWVSISTLVVGCIGAIITEFSGIAGVGILYGVPVWLSVSLTALFLIVLAWSGNYRSVERIALAIGSFELIYLIIAYQVHPSSAQMLSGLRNLPIYNTNYLYLVAANIGAVIMPWMVFYQQSAIVDKKLNVKHLTASRWETAIGAIITQLIMAAIIIVTAATLGKNNPGASLNNVQQISNALIPFVGHNMGRLLFSLGMLGASLVAAIVVSLTAAWAIGEITSFKHSLQNSPKEAPWFYAIYSLILILGGILVASDIHLVHLNVAIEFMNALLLPIVLSLLFLLARKALPAKYRLKGWYAVLVGVCLTLTAIFGIFAGISGLTI